MTDVVNKEYLTVKDTAVLLNICNQQAYRLFNQRGFPLLKVGGKKLVKKTDLDEYLHSTAKGVSDGD